MKRWSACGSWIESLALCTPDLKSLSTSFQHSKCTGSSTLLNADVAGQGWKQPVPFQDLAFVRFPLRDVIRRYTGNLPSAASEL